MFNFNNQGNQDNQGNESGILILNRIQDSRSKVAKTLSNWRAEFPLTGRAVEIASPAAFDFVATKAYSR
jgi:hypothetical protein